MSSDAENDTKPKAAPTSDAVYDRQIRLWGADAQVCIML